MKRSILFLVAVLVTGTVYAQHEHHGMMHRNAAGVKLDVKEDAAAQEVTLRVGPLDLPAHTDHMGVAQAPDFFWVVPFDGWLIAYHPSLVDDAGNPLLNHLLHHVGFWNTGRSDFLCPGKEEHIFGAGGEMNDWPAIPGYGYRVAKGDRIRIGTMFHNPTDIAYPKTYLKVKVEYRLRGPSGSQLKSAYPAWFDVMQCGNSGYDLKPGENVTTGEVTVRYTGTLLGVGGHLHDYGQRLVLVDLTRKQDIATLNSKLNPQGNIVSMPIENFTDRGGYRLNQGDRIRVTATYDNLTGKPLPDGAMGIVVGYFVPDDEAKLAALKRTPAKRPAKSSG